MRWPGDDERLADLNVFFVHTPTAWPGGTAQDGSH
jgi:hypothetical protein